MVSSKVHGKFFWELYQCTAKVLSAVSYPGFYHAFWTCSVVGAVISGALSAKP